MNKETGKIKSGDKKFLLKVDNNLLTNNEDIAKAFGTFFTNVPIETCFLNAYVPSCNHDFMFSIAPHHVIKAFQLLNHNETEYLCVTCSDETLSIHTDAALVCKMADRRRRNRTTVNTVVEKLQPISLTDIAFNAALLDLWQNSALPLLIADLAYKKKQAMLTEEALDKSYQNIRKTLDNLQNFVFNFKKVPFRLKIKLNVAIDGLTHSIKKFALEISSGIIKCLKQNLKFCISKIVLTPNGDVDKIKTILDIYRDSKFQILFDTFFMAVYCVEATDVEIISKFVIEEILTREASKKRKCKAVKKNNEEINHIKRVVDSVMSGALFWEMQSNTSDDLDYNIKHASDIEFISISGHFEALRFYFNYLKAYRRKNDLEDAAKFSLFKHCYTEHTVIFFYQNLLPDVWAELLLKYFVGIFHCLIASWNYRHYCSLFFKSVVDKIDIETYRSLLSGIGFAWYQGTFDYYDIFPIIQSIWLDTPKHMREDIAVSYIFIPEIILIKGDIGSIPYFLSFLSKETQKGVLAEIMFGLIATSRGHFVRQCFCSAKSLKLDVTRCKDLLTKEAFKTFLLIDARKAYSRAYINIDDFLTFMFDSETDAGIFKQELFNDTNFITQFLVDFSRHTNDMDKFLKWGLGDKRSIKKFKRYLVDSLIIHDVYDRRLVENTYVETADEIFEFLKISKHKVLLIKNSVSDNPDVIVSLLINFLETDRIECTYEHLLHFLPYNEHKQFMENFLFSDVGIDAIYNMFLILPTHEMKRSLGYNVSSLMDFYLTIKISWLQPYGLVERMDIMLEEKGHPNSRGTKVYVKDCKVLTPEQENSARQIVDSCYKCFRAMLNKDFTVFHFIDAEDLDIVTFSRNMITLANITVPTVL